MVLSPQRPKPNERRSDEKYDYGEHDRDVHLRRRLVHIGDRLIGVLRIEAHI